MTASTATDNPKATPGFARDVPTVQFRAAYEAHFAHVWHTLRRLGMREADLEDGAHDVFVVVHRRLVDFDSTRPIKPWLTGIAYRVASDARRRAHVRRERVGNSEWLQSRPASGPSPEQLAVAQQARDIVHAALERLDFDRRVVFVMHELEGLTAPEIAELVDVPLNTVYSRLRVARGRFRDAVRRAGKGAA